MEIFNHLIAAVAENVFLKTILFYITTEWQVIYGGVLIIA
jgi:hypothetical protein